MYINTLQHIIIFYVYIDALKFCQNFLILTAGGLYSIIW